MKRILLAAILLLTVSAREPGVSMSRLNDTFRAESFAWVDRSFRPIWRDDHYSPVSSEWMTKTLWPELWKRYQSFRPDGWDCDDYALDAVATAARLNPGQGGIAVGILALDLKEPLFGKTGAHALNVFFDGTDWWLFEPQDGSKMRAIQAFSKSKSRLLWMIF